jgi:tRNA threonylcarbamoyladenosine biosynthesis protein TsaE
LERETEAEELGLEDYFQGEGITAIEWADKIPSLLPKEMLFIHIAYTGKNTRSIEMIGKGKRFEDLVNQLRISDPGINSKSAFRILHSEIEKRR